MGLSMRRPMDYPMRYTVRQPVGHPMRRPMNTLWDVLDMGPPMGPLIRCRISHGKSYSTPVYSCYTKMRIEALSLVIRDAEVAPTCLRRSLVLEKNGEGYLAPAAKR